MSNDFFVSRRILSFYCWFMCRFWWIQSEKQKVFRELILKCIKIVNFYFILRNRKHPTDGVPEKLRVSLKWRNRNCANKRKKNILDRDKLICRTQKYAKRRVTIEGKKFEHPFVGDSNDDFGTFGTEKKRMSWECRRDVCVCACVCVVKH